MYRWKHLPFFLLIWNLLLVAGRDQHPTFQPLIPWDCSGDKHEEVTRIEKRSSLDETAARSDQENASPAGPDLLPAEPTTNIRTLARHRCDSQRPMLYRGTPSHRRPTTAPALWCFWGTPQRSP